MPNLVKAFQHFVRVFFIIQDQHAAGLRPDRTTNEMMTVCEYETVLHACGVAFRLMDDDAAAKETKQTHQPRHPADDKIRVMKGDKQPVVAASGKKFAHHVKGRRSAQWKLREVGIKNSDLVAGQAQHLLEARNVLGPAGKQMTLRLKLR